MHQCTAGDKYAADTGNHCNSHASMNISTTYTRKRQNFRRSDIFTVCLIVCLTFYKSLCILCTELFCTQPRSLKLCMRFHLVLPCTLVTYLMSFAISLYNRSLVNFLHCEILLRLKANSAIDAWQTDRWLDD